MKTITQKWSTSFLNFALIESWQKEGYEVEIIGYDNHYDKLDLSKPAFSTAIVELTPPQQKERSPKYWG